MDPLEERRLSRAVIAASAGVFLALFAIQQSVFETPDEAKYIGLGLNLLAGRGLVTDLGAQFLSHPPLWPLVLAAPQAWLGVDALAVGHVLDALAGAAAIVLAAALAWRARPAAGAVTAVALLATSYLAGLARTAGIDLPAAVLALAYLLVASRAIERGSVRLALLAGALFGLGFLTKETVLPFAPIPFLVALGGQARGSAIARTGAAALLAASVVCGWWFVVYASLTGTVYRLGGPAWLLVPAGLGTVVLIALGLAQPRLPSLGALGLNSSSAPAYSPARLRALIAWAAIGTWLLAQLVVYARAAKLGGAALIRASQLTDDVRVYLPQLGLILGFALVGSVLAVVHGRRSQPVRELAAGAVAQLPLIVLVLGIGETPRHYIAAIALAAGLGAVGWIAAAGARSSSAGRLGLLAGVLGALALAAPQLVKAPLLGAALVTVVVGIVAVWSLARPRLPVPTPAIRFAGVRLGTAALAVAVTFLVGAGIATATAYRASQGTPVGVAERRAVEEVGAWLRASLPPGATIMVGPGLAYQLALAVHDRERVVRYQPGSASTRAGTPFGLTAGGHAIAQPVTLEAALRNVDVLDVYEAGPLTARIHAVRPAAWVEAVYLPSGDAADPVLAMFDGAAGVVRLANWAYPYGDQQLVIVAYSLDPDRFAPRSDATFASPTAIDVAARLLGAARDAAAAAALLDHLVAVPAGPDADAALAALRAAAGR